VHEQGGNVFDRKGPALPDFIGSEEASDRHDLALRIAKILLALCGTYE